jgi:hypothetical protein
MELERRPEIQAFRNSAPHDARCCKVDARSMGRRGCWIAAAVLQLRSAARPSHCKIDGKQSSAVCYSANCMCAHTNGTGSWAQPQVSRSGLVVEFLPPAASFRALPPHRGPPPKSQCFRSLKCAICTAHQRASRGLCASRVAWQWFGFLLQGARPRGAEGASALKQAVHVRIVEAPKASAAQDPLWVPLWKHFNYALPPRQLGLAPARLPQQPSPGAPPAPPRPPHRPISSPLPATDGGGPEPGRRGPTQPRPAQSAQVLL